MSNVVHMCYLREHQQRASALVAYYQLIGGGAEQEEHETFSSTSTPWHPPSFCANLYYTDTQTGTAEHAGK